MATTTETHLANIAIEKQESAAWAFVVIQEVGECRWTPSWQEDAAEKYAAAREAYDQLLEHLNPRKAGHRAIERAVLLSDELRDE
jgi:hypothetical protein